MARHNLTLSSQAENNSGFHHRLENELRGGKLPPRFNVIFSLKLRSLTPCHNKLQCAESELKLHSNAAAYRAAVHNVLRLKVKLYAASV